MKKLIPTLVLNPSYSHLSFENEAFKDQLMKAFLRLILNIAILKGHPLLSRHKPLMHSESWLSQVLSTSL